MKGTDIYLGYGVYAENDPDRDQIILKVSRDEGEHFVALTVDELRELNRFAARCFGSEHAKGCEPK